MVNVFSFCIFGPPNPLYYDGLLENIDIISLHFRDWLVYIYVGNDVSESYINKLLVYSNVRIIRTGISGFRNTIYRFFAYDDPIVDVVMFRDADSRIHWKDRWAINMFLNQTSCKAHVIRDHKEHACYIPAGLWGMRRGAFSGSIQEIYNNWVPRYQGNGDPKNVEGFGVDQNFLSDIVYSKIVYTLYVNCSFRILFVNEIGTTFPFEWNDKIYCGRVEHPVRPFRIGQ
jgi:hypothetical protein